MDICKETCQDTCPICLDDIKPDDKISTTCNHVFCKSCYNTVFKEEFATPCPMCRTINIKKCCDNSNKFDNMTIDELHKYFIDIYSSKECNNLKITNELYYFITYIFKNNDLLNYLISNDANEKEFKCTYNEIIINKKRNFKNFDCVYSDFTLSFLYYKYH